MCNKVKLGESKAARLGLSSRRQKQLVQYIMAHLERRERSFDWITGDNMTKCMVL